MTLYVMLHYYSSHKPAQGLLLDRSLLLLLGLHPPHFRPPCLHVLFQLLPFLLLVLHAEWQSL